MKGDSTVTAVPLTVAAPGRKRHRQDTESLVGGPRLLTLAQAALYLGIGVWAVRGLINTGKLKVVVIERPRTPEAMKPRARKPGAPKTAPTSDALRMIRLDRADLDDFVDGCAHERRALEWNQ